ncbi:MAG TPA: hypothetical protein VM913_02780, partial [Sphingomicrobium sp.]|nr:hypothetical protein [Sphingomicrobium sp.]
MNWFGRKSAPAPAALPAWTSLACATDGDVNPLSYGARVREVFLTNPVGQRSVRLVAGTVSALPIDLVEG